MGTHEVPDVLPVLSRGKHRSPRKGACFMEMASVLADEPWSDHPACTHPLLAQLARLVNDHTSDDHRSELAVLIPDVVGVHGDGLGWEVSLAAAVAAEAILDVPAEQQRALAAGLVRCEQLAAADDADQIRAALELVPAATRWARAFSQGWRPLQPRQFRRRTAPTMMRCSVQGIAGGAVTDPDARLRDVLQAALTAARRAAPTPSVDTLPSVASLADEYGSAVRR
jgi:hypothetical protein